MNQNEGNEILTTESRIPSEPLPVLSARARVQSPRHDTQILDEVLIHHIRLEAMISDISFWMGAKGKKKTELRHDFMDRYWNIPPEQALEDVLLNLIGLRTKIKLEREERQREATRKAHQDATYKELARQQKELKKMRAKKSGKQPTLAELRAQRDSRRY